MAGVLRGDVYWADLDPVRGHEQAGRRPVLVISVDPFNNRSGTVIAMAITSKPGNVGLPLSLPLPPRILAKPSWVRISQVRTISIERLEKKLGRVGDEFLSEVIEGLLELVT